MNERKSTVRARCLRFINVLEAKNLLDLPLDEAKNIFMNEIGIFDRMSLKAYFGSQKLKSKQVLNKEHRYATGTVSLSTITYTRKLTIVRGYFEILGLAKIEEVYSKLYFCVNLKGIVNDLKVRYPSPSTPIPETLTEKEELIVGVGEDSKGLSPCVNLSLSSIGHSSEGSLGGSLPVSRGVEGGNKEIEKKKIISEREKSEHPVITEDQKMEEKLIQAYGEIVKRKEEKKETTLEPGFMDRMRRLADQHKGETDILVTPMLHNSDVKA